MVKKGEEGVGERSLEGLNGVVEEEEEVLLS